MRKKQKTVYFHNQRTVVPSTDHRRKSVHPRVSPNKNLCLPAEPEIPTSSSPEVGVAGDQLENKLYGVVELLEEAISGHRKLRTEVLPQQRLKFDQFCDELRRLLVMEANKTDMRTEPLVETAGDSATARDSPVDRASPKMRSTAEESVELYEDSIQAKIDQFVNWYDLWQTELIREMQLHLEEASRKLKTLVIKEPTVDCEMVPFRWDERRYQPTHPFVAGLQQKSNAVDKLCSIPERQPNRIDERVDFVDRSHSNSEDIRSDRSLMTSTPTIPFADGVVEPEILCVPVASIGPECASAGRACASSGPVCASDSRTCTSLGPVCASNGPACACSGPVRVSNGPAPTSIGPECASISPACASLGPPIQESLRTSKMAHPSAKLPQIVSTLQQKCQEQSLPTVANAHKVHHLRVAASQEVDQLWQSIDTHRVEALPCDSLCTCMRNLVLLSLMAEPKELFYQHVLYCAQQLRNPANINELAIVSSSTDAPAHATSYQSSMRQYLVLLTPQEKSFYKQVRKLKPSMLVMWGSAYACLLLRLSDRGVAYVCRKLAQLNRQLAEAYGVEPKSLPQVPLSSASFVKRLRLYSKYRVDSVGQNTLYKGLIERYECTAPPPRTKKLLNFLLLTSLRYRGMSLITLVDECRKVYGISVAELVRKTLADETRDSWRSYDRFTSTWIQGSLCRKYKYCQVFCVQMYSELRFNANANLCWLLSRLIDDAKLRSGASAPQLYQKLVERACQVDARWKQKCAQIIKKFAN